MTMKRLPAFVPKAAVALCLLTPLTSGLPLQMVINQRATECIYDKVEEGEHVTMSVFVLSGSELKATAIMEGPVAPPHVNSGFELDDAIEKFRNDDHYGKFISVTEVIDYESLIEEFDDDDDDDYEEDWDDDDMEGSAEARRRMTEDRSHRTHERHHERQRTVKHQKGPKKNVLSEGEPFQKTLRAEASGWYRLCVRGTWYQIGVEMELRTEKSLGGIDTDTGHVWTYEQRVVMDEEKMLEEDTASQEEGVQDEDFETTRDQLGRLRKLMADIQSKQLNERHRLAVHSATNEHSHSRMVLTSLLETVLFMAVTGFQIYTIRKWFQGSPALG